MKPKWKASTWTLIVTTLLAVAAVVVDWPVVGVGPLAWTPALHTRAVIGGIISAVGMVGIAVSVKLKCDGR